MNSSDGKLTLNQAYRAMYHYLDALYERTHSDDLAGFLGGLSLLPDGKPADPGVSQDWKEAVEKAVGNTVSIDLQPHKG